MANVRYDKADNGSMRRAAFHDAMADVHSMVSLEHGDKSMSRPLSRKNEFHNSAANAHANLSEYHYDLAKSGTTAGLRSMSLPAGHPNASKYPVGNAFEIRN